MRDKDEWGKRLKIAADAFSSAQNHTSQLAALMAYQNELTHGLEQLFGQESIIVAPARALLVEIDLLLARRKSGLLRTASDRRGTPLNAAEHQLRMLTAIALDLYRRGGLAGVELFTKVASDLTQAGHRIRNRPIKAGTIEDWSQELHRFGKLKIAHEEAVGVLAGMPDIVEVTFAEAAVKRFLQSS